MANNQDENTTVPVIGELFNRRLRKAGLTHKELAELSGVSVRKISDCVAGQPAKPSIVKAVAPHLGLTYEELTGAIPEQSGPLPPHKSVSISHNADGSVIVQIIFAKNCKPPLKPHARKYLRAIVTLLGLENDFDDDDFTALAGSLVVTVPLSRRDAAKLMNGFFAGELEQFNVVSVAVSMHPTGLPNRQSAKTEGLLVSRNRHLDQPQDTESARKQRTNRPLPLDPGSIPLRPTLRSITATVARKFGLKSSDLTGRSRSRAIFQPRSIAIYLATKLTDKRLYDIGLYFGFRSHTVVLHSCSTIASLIVSDPAIQRTITDLRAALTISERHAAAESLSTSN